MNELKTRIVSEKSLCAKLDEIAETDSELFSKCVDRMTDKLNSFIRNGLFFDYMLDASYLRQLLYDTISEECETDYFSSLWEIYNES